MLSWAAGLSLDLKLGLRMLVKYPGLTVIGVLGMAVAVAFGAVTFSCLYTAVDTTLPLDEGDRVVGQRPSWCPTNASASRLPRTRPALAR